MFSPPSSPPTSSPTSSSSTHPPPFSPPSFQLPLLPSPPMFQPTLTGAHRNITHDVPVTVVPERLWTDYQEPSMPDIDVCENLTTRLPAEPLRWGSLWIKDTTEGKTLLIKDTPNVHHLAVLILLYPFNRWNDWSPEVSFIGKSNGGLARYFPNTITFNYYFHCSFERKDLLSTVADPEGFQSVVSSHSGCVVPLPSCCPVDGLTLLVERPRCFCSTCFCSPCHHMWC